MTSPENTPQTNTLPPPRLGDFAMTTMAPPEGYTAPERQRLSTYEPPEAIGSRALLGAGESLALQTSVRIPSYNDKYKVYDTNGDIVYGIDGAALDLRTCRLVPESADDKWSEDAGYPKYTTVEGKTLVVEGGPSKKIYKTWHAFGTFIYKKYDNRFNYEASESASNTENQEIIQKTVAAGPDDDERIVFATENVNGRLQKYNGTPLTQIEESNYKRQIKTAKINRARYQGLAAFEIGKREEQEQGGVMGVWLQIANKMHSELGYTHNEIAAVYVGLQYMKKGQYLTLKHTPLVLVGKDGSELDNTLQELYKSGKLTEAQRKGTKLVFGPLKEREYVNELAEKVAGHQTTFSSTDVMDAVRLARSLRERMDLDRNSGTVRKKNRREYQNAGFIMHKLWSVVENSRMASLTGPDKDGAITPQGVEEDVLHSLPLPQPGGAPAGRSGGYPPRMSGSAEANQAWKILAEVVDGVAAKHPVVKVFNEEEYSASAKQLSKY